VKPTVQIAFDLSLAGAGDFFTLNDPAKGELDNTDFLLAGDILTDVSNDVRSVTLRRGRSGETNAVSAATVNVTLDNTKRLYDPIASASVTPYAPSILPRKALRVTIGGESLFNGQVEDWDLRYAMGGDSITVAECSDGFALLAEQTLASGAGATGLSGSVIYQAASAVGWPLGRTSLDEGTASVGAHTISNNQNVLQYMQKIANTESALLFVDKEGSLAFRDRISPRRNLGTLFSDDGSGIPFSNIEIIFGTEFLYTQIVVNYPGGSASATSASAAIANYGLTELSLDTFLPDGTSAGVIAAFLAERYGEPTLRITSVDVEVDSLTPAQQAQLLSLDLGDGARVVFTPNGIGEPIDKELGIDAIEHNIVPGSHLMRFRFFEPFLSRASGSISGVSGTVGFVLGAKGKSGSVSGSSGTAGSVLGAKGAEGTVTGSSGTAGSVTGTAQTAFVLNTSELDGTDTLSA
jgi:hypothetical protein